MQNPRPAPGPPRQTPWVLTHISNSEALFYRMTELQETDRFWVLGRRL